MFWSIAHLMLKEATETLVTCFTTCTANKGGVFSLNLIHVVGSWEGNLLVVLALSSNLLQSVLEMQRKRRPCNGKQHYL